jgi:hypothetical protein
MAYEGLENANTHLPIAKAAAAWARFTGGPRPDKCTLIRWATKGVRGHRLRAERFGTRWYCRPSALVEFHRLLNAPVHTAPPADPKTRAAEIEAANRRLDELVPPIGGPAS